MTETNFYQLLQLDKEQQQSTLAEVNKQLQAMTAQQRIKWALKYLPGSHILSSSFGVQSALMLHLINEQQPDMPVVLTDTGYLFSETYQFIEQMRERFKLNLKVYRSDYSSAWQEAKYGKLWEQGLEGIDTYNRINKVEPMQRALQELKVKTWFSGLRAEQSDSRKDLPILAIRSGVYKFLPIIDWSTKQVRDTMFEYDLPYNPLYDKGYVSIGDTHTSRPLSEGEKAQDTRFLGLKRECGLHWDI
ncbi:phosphoadenylyl-sulfate reductase [Paraferrimonas sp. SM1919]|uniref:phosphoadenylyl-sulfate reductase n=1 Tax=Paraferrimonas sp. SM1919 TaxID=2662263 RepID=UPI0013D407E9|nr:phosphoadenylyl-sulfate reductase [Paraferrimonas sp. SM1919]